MTFTNTYEDIQRAVSYSILEFPGTYYLAYRDLPAIISDYALKGKALDFGCGTGRSTRFLKDLGYEAIGIDISEEMLKIARQKDPEGIYQFIEGSDFSILGCNKFDLILSVFTFDNIPGRENRANLFSMLKERLNKNGKMIILDSTPELYLNDWASFITTVFEENKNAESGQTVKTIMTDVDDRRPVEDILWKDFDYREAFNSAGLKLIKSYKPLGYEDEPYNWVNETRIAPWIIYVLG